MADDRNSGQKRVEQEKERKTMIGLVVEELKIKIRSIRSIVYLFDKYQM